MSRGILWGWLCTLSLCGFAQVNPYLQGYFVSPLEIPIQLAGNFGEPRRSHFHTGLDMRTLEREGLPIHAAADGYVSRIGVSAYGYGNVLYLTHPNGYTTVYAHLQRFAPAIAQRLREIQYSNQRFETDFNLKPNEIRVRQGDIVAWSGNTGGSGGPHLHFEIRDSQERPINPLLFGYRLVDHTAPIVNGLKIYSLDADRYFSDGWRVAVVAKGNTYTVPNLIRVNSSRIGIAVNTWDKMDGGIHSLGVYQIRLHGDGSQLFQYTADRISFDYRRQIICEVDYPIFLREGSKSFHKCFLEPGNILPCYTDVVNQGEIDLSDGQRHHIHIQVRDYNGNVATVDAEIQMDVNVVKKATQDHSYVKTLSPVQNNIYATTGFSFIAPPRCMPDYIYANYERTSADKPSVYSDIHRFDYPWHHLLDYATIGIQPTTLPESLRDKSLIVWRDEQGRPQARAAYWADGLLTAKVRELGTYYIGIDTTPPSIRPLNIPATGRVVGIITLAISDNFAGISSYQVWIDEQWILAEHDGKAGTLTIHLPDDMVAGGHTLKVTVIDGCKNTAVYSRIVYR